MPREKLSCYDMLLEERRICTTYARPQLKQYLNDVCEGD